MFCFGLCRFVFLSRLLDLDLEYRYWTFVEAHPSHVVLEERAKQEVYEAINWSMTSKLFLMRHNESLMSSS